MNKYSTVDESLLKPKTIKEHHGMNRRMFRQRFIDRTYTKSTARHVVNDYGYQIDHIMGTNHERLLLRRAKREALKIKV